jgi:LmbE family N-acetylglucosaminyl deacetylase
MRGGQNSLGVEIFPSWRAAIDAIRYVEVDQVRANDSGRGFILFPAHGNVSPEIWTILAGEPPLGPLSEFARQNHALWGINNAEQAVAIRREEDEAAAFIVGADLVHFDIPDCIYRRSPGGEYLYIETVLTSPHPSDRRLYLRIATALRSELRQDDVLVCPLGLGGHVDHVLVRRAAESLQRPLLYYADVPYILNYPGTLPAAITSLASQQYRVSETGLDAWLRAVAAYRSQVDSLYKGEGNLFDAIRSFWAGERGIRLWHAR